MSQFASVQQSALRPIAAPDLARLFGLSMVKTHQLMRSRGFPSFKIGRNRYTTEAWLAGWMSGQLKNPPPVKNFDPLENAVVERCAWAVGELVKRGEIRICAEENGRVHTSLSKGPMMPGGSASAQTLPHLDNDFDSSREVPARDDRLLRGTQACFVAG